MPSKGRGSINQRLIHALGHEIRVEILEALLKGPASPNQISKRTGRPISNIDYHVKVLKECGSLELDAERPARGAIEHFYRLKPHAFIGNQEWRKVPIALRSSVSGESLQRFMALAVEAVESGTLECDEATFDWMPVPLDPRGLKEATDALNAARQAILGVHKKSARRLARNGKLATTYVIGLAGFEVGRETAPTGSKKPLPNTEE
jgi:DNA-binding transcriptional ArsR family regulator